MSGPEIKLDEVSHLVAEAYIPFANIERAIVWPGDDERLENDAEHSFSVAIVAGAVAERIGLDPQKAAALGLAHDLVELYAGDTSIWDETAAQTKQAREQEGLIRFKQTFASSPWLGSLIEEYEAQTSEEARLVYALDKLLAILVIVESGGAFWKQNSITYEDHLAKVGEVRPKIAANPLVLAMYDDLLQDVEARQTTLFAIK